MHANSSLDGLAGLIALQRLSLDAALQAVSSPTGERSFAAHLDLQALPAAPEVSAAQPDDAALVAAEDPQAEGDAHLELLLAYL